jgi:uncharacterized membrane protein
VSENDPLAGLRAWTHVIYALHAWTVLTGIASAAFIVAVFLFGWPSLVAVLLNYVKRADAAGSFLESHFRWQIRTFWFAALWVLIGAVLWLTLLLIPLAIAVWVLTGLWVTYRVARGWLALLRTKPLPG